MSNMRQEKELIGRAGISLWIWRLRNDARGQDLVEYALAAGMVAVAAVAAMPLLGSTVNTVFSKVGSIIQSSVN
jgi:pilus assembly protein Flp/PilA